MTPGIMEGENRLSHSLRMLGRGVFFALLSALLLIGSFPPFGIALLAWVALVPLLVAIRGRNLTAGFLLPLLTGASFFIGIFYWLSTVNGFTWVDFVLGGTYLGSYFGLFGVSYCFISRRTHLPTLITAPCLWVSAEYLRSHAGFLGLPWALLGHSQYLNLPLIQIASFTGVYGVSFLIVMVNVTLSEILLSWTMVTQKIIARRWSPIFTAIIVTLFALGLSFAYGVSAISRQVLGETIRVTVVQGNIAQESKWRPELQQANLEKHIGLTIEAAEAGQTSLIVWPEATVPGPLTPNLSFAQTLSALARQVSTALLVGSSQRPKFGSAEFRSTTLLNSAFLISPEGRLQAQYQKIHLLPFAEYLPYKDVFPWPPGLAAKVGNFTPGTEYKILNLNGHRFSVLICWETIFPDLVRQFVNNGAEFLVDIANEAWFGETAAPYQFVSMNVFRAVENHIAIARSANTGISCFIDPYGRVIGKIQDGTRDIFISGYLTKDIPLSQQKTFYTLYGDVWAYSNLAMTLLLFGVYFFYAPVR